MPDTEVIEVVYPDEPELNPDVVLDPEDTHVEGVDAPEAWAVSLETSEEQEEITDEAAEEE